jgi:MFS superfamily sulfate permease-like transporter
MLAQLKSGIKFNRLELSGAFGDIGTDFPLITAMILAAGLHTPSVLIMFGITQILTGLIYKMPMPAQPLKAMATIVIAQQVGGPILVGAGLAIGIVMLLLSGTGLLKIIADYIPKSVVRGIQLGLGVTLCLLATKNYIASAQLQGYIIAGVSLVIILLFIDSKKYPAALILISLGVVYGLIFNTNVASLVDAVGVNLPIIEAPTIENMVAGFMLLALPQIPLSIGNSIVATRQVANDLFPDRKPLSITRIGLTYSIMNLINPFFGGIPVCHGSGGMVGHYTFGGRTGGSVIIYGSFYIVLGLFFGDGFDQIVHIFPLPILGCILFFEGLALIMLVKDQLSDVRALFIAIIVGMLAVGLNYGFFVAMVIGTILHYLPLKFSAMAKK